MTSVLAVFGGTDPSAAVLTLAPLLLSTGERVHLRAIASTPATMQALARLEDRPGASALVVEPPADDLPALVQQSDLVISAAGSSSSGSCCASGAPTAAGYSASRTTRKSPATARSSTAAWSRGSGTSPPSGTTSRPGAAPRPC